MSLYEHMTMDASGWLDPRLCEAVGKTGLRWVYGTNHPDAKSEQYWIDECAKKTLAIPTDHPQLISAGVAIDEWVPPKDPAIEAFIADGLREAKRLQPELFIVVWFTDLRPTLTQLIKDGTVDLGIVQGYTHTAPRYGQHAWLAWDTCLKRCDAVAKADVLDKTIFSFGHITDEQTVRGDFLRPDWIEDKMREIKQRFPEMPGVAFFQSDGPDTPALRNLAQHCDQLSGELWP